MSECVTAQDFWRAVGTQACNAICDEIGVSHGVFSLVRIGKKDFGYKSGRAFAKVAKERHGIVIELDSLCDAVARRKASDENAARSIAEQV